MVLMALGMANQAPLASIPKATAPDLKGSPNSTKAKRGDFGGDMTLLARFYSPPTRPRESNHFIDMWSGGKMAEFVRGHGLTNNRALFIISHGRGRSSGGKWRYALYPAESELKVSAKMPYYSPQDIARILNLGVIEQIDNLIISGCNEENLLDLTEWRACFPKATNIIHAAAGKDGYDFLLRHALLYRTPEIKWLYDTPESFSLGGDDDGKDKPKKPAKLNLYLASLYRPGAMQPYHVQIAGRELLEDGRTVETTAAVATRTVPASVRPAVTRPTVGVHPTKAASSRPPIIIRRAKPPNALPAPASSLLTCAAAAFGVLALIFGTRWLLFGVRYVSARISQRELPSNVPTDQQPSECAAPSGTLADNGMKFRWCQLLKGLRKNFSDFVN